MMAINSKLYGKTPEEKIVTEYTLTNRHGIEMKVINYGCTITSLKVPDRDGKPGDIVLGFDSLAGYLASTHYVGCLVGRYANRIANGSFILDEREYILAKNLYPHQLHGGMKGFDKTVWSAAEFQNDDGVGIEFKYLSPDGEEGFPGNVLFTIRYFLNQDNEITFDYFAITDQKTIINLAQHSYFNLSQGIENILAHELMIHAHHFLPVDKTMIPTGEIKSVEGTPFDFTVPKIIASGIGSDDVQIRDARGYDHNMILDKINDELSHAATLYDAASGRVLEVFTTEPGLQLYTGNFLDDSVSGKNDNTYGRYSGLCLETQHFPDSPNHPEFPSVVLSPGEEYRSKTVWKFSSRSHSFVNREM